MECPTSLIARIRDSFFKDMPFATSAASFKTTEFDLVRGILQVLQGNSSSLFYWDQVGQCYRAKAGLYVLHLSMSSLHGHLNQFLYAATCLRLVEHVVNKVQVSVRSSPTLRAFVAAVSAWLEMLRDIALKEETEIIKYDSDSQCVPTLLGMASSLSRSQSIRCFTLRLLEFGLEQNGSFNFLHFFNYGGVAESRVLHSFGPLNSISRAGVSSPQVIHNLPIQGYGLSPSNPPQNLFIIYYERDILRSEYLLNIVCETIPPVPLDSLPHVPAAEVAVCILDHLYKRLHEVCQVQGGEEEPYRMLLYLFVGSLLPCIECLDSWLYEGILDDPFNEMFFYENKTVSISDAEFWEKSYLLRSFSPQKSDPGLSNATQDRNVRDLEACPLFLRDMARAIVSAGKSLQLIRHVPANSDLMPSNSDGYYRFGSLRSADDSIDLGGIYCRRGTAGLTLSEVFCISLSGLIADGDHVHNKLWHENLHSVITPSPEGSERQIPLGDTDGFPPLASKGKMWTKLLGEVLKKDELENIKSFCPQNPALTVSKKFLDQNRHAWSSLNLSKHFHLPPLDDEDLWESIFSMKIGVDASKGGTNYAFGFQFTEPGHFRSQDDIKVLESLFPFPTILPSCEGNHLMSEVLPLQKNSTLSSRFLRWIQVAEPKSTPLPMVFLQECLILYVKKQVDYIGGCMLSKLLNDWRLMDQLEVLRAIYLLGSGDLLQHFLTVIFNRLDKGESWDDEFELNILLQESITNSADRMILSAPDSLVVSIMKPSGLDGSDTNNSNNFVSTPRKIHEQSLGINGLDMLNFSYKVSWPLELIANTEAIKKYNQVMRFLLKVRRAKYVLDKARRWIWKDKKSVSFNSKHRWLLEQKLLHFIDAFHQYVMDRVYHSAWRELCNGMAAARSLDEVIEVHDAYLLSIQRQCFVVPDKLWALIASRINKILGLALDFYSIQQTLNSGGAISAVKARCVTEVDRIEKQFDDCIAFLLRVLSFKLNVGHFPHLADLVTRINYNHYYMSDTGNMINAPGSETVKLGKTFPTRTS